MLLGFDCNQCGAPPSLDKIQRKIRGIRGLAGKIDARDQTPQQPAHEHRDHDVRRLYVAIGPGYRTWFNGRKPETSILRCRNTAKSLKRRLRAFFLLVIRMSVLSLRICLPELQDGVGNTLAIGVENTASDDDALSSNPGTSQIVLKQPVHANEEIRTNGL